MTGGEESRSLEQTPTWAIASVCAVFVVISIFIEHAILLVTKWQWPQKRHKKALSEALERVRSELMLLGFISLLLPIGQKPISMVCISDKVAGTMLPCKKIEKPSSGHHRKLLWESGGSIHFMQHVLTSEDPRKSTGSEHCPRGKVPVISEHGMHHLHIFIFILAIFHVVSSILTMGLGGAKMRRWKAWEKETKTEQYQFSHGMLLSQFYKSVTKVDYLTLRHGFISTHVPNNRNFDFHKYIKRSLEDDFKVVVGVSPTLWAFAVIFLLLNVQGKSPTSSSVILQLVDDFSLAIFRSINLIVGTKLQLVITEMALEIQQKHAVIRGSPVVNPSDKLFWFSRPQLTLFLIHFSLFQNAFQIAFFIWTWLVFGMQSCFPDVKLNIIRIVMGIGVQFLCSYITFPQYALVTQMGSHMKKAIFEEQTAHAVTRWHQMAKKNHKRFGYTSGENTPNQCTSPIRIPPRHKSTGDLPSVQHSPQISNLSECELSDLEMDVSPPASSLPSPKHSISLWKLFKSKEKREAIDKPHSDKESTHADTPSHKKETSVVRVDRNPTTTDADADT
eukprot:Gb_04083 [translate_table: standard]